MEKTVKRIGYLPRKRVLEIIDQISKSESISRSKVVGILVEEALDARGIANFGYSNLNKSKVFNSEKNSTKPQVLAIQKMNLLMIVGTQFRLTKL